MKGRQFIYAFQAGVTYRAADWLSIYAGARMNYFVGGYKGYVTATAKPELLQNPVLQAAAAANSQLAAMANQPLVDLRLDVDQKGWGLAPIIGAHIKLNKWNIGLKYELKANLNIENETKENSDPNGALAAYSDGVNTPSDVPALFSGAVMYEILPTLRASVEYHHFFDKNAEMANDKQRALTRGTNEYQVGVEWDAHKYFSLSAGYQRTDYGLSDEFQYDTSFYCDSYSMGLGGVIHLSQRMKVNVGYFWTHYRKYTKQSANYNGTTLPGTNVYSRHNKVFGASIDYIF
jgi:long-chain fatty acid transport protein